MGDEETRDFLRRHYGVKFPRSLWQTQEFLSSLEPDVRSRGLGALGLRPTGVLEVLASPDDRSRLPEPKLPLLLHWRFYRDPPEFFSCLHGDTDGLHWGLLLDAPDDGFKGVASFYTNDASAIRLHPSLLAAVREHATDRIDGNEENVRHDAGEADHYRKQVEILRDFRSRLDEFVRANGIELDERRPAGLPSDTGLSVIAPGEPQEPSRWSFFDAPHRPKSPHELTKNARLALNLADAGQAYPALCLGRSLWYWGGSTQSRQAYELLARAYDVLERPALRHVLDVHYQNRELPNVDLLRQA